MQFSYLKLTLLTVATWKQHVMVLTAKTCLRAKAVNTPRYECYKNVKKKNHDRVKTFFFKMHKNSTASCALLRRANEAHPSVLIVPLQHLPLASPLLNHPFPLHFLPLKRLTHRTSVAVCLSWHLASPDDWVLCLSLPPSASLPWWDPTNIFIAPSPLSFFSVA